MDSPFTSIELQERVGIGGTADVLNARMFALIVLKIYSRPPFLLED